MRGTRVWHFDSPSKRQIHGALRARSVEGQRGVGYYFLSAALTLLEINRPQCAGRIPPCARLEAQFRIVARSTPVDAALRYVGEDFIGVTVQEGIDPAYRPLACALAD